MYSYCICIYIYIYIGALFLFRYSRVQVYTMWVHGPLGLMIFLSIG